MTPIEIAIARLESLLKRQQDKDDGSTFDRAFMAGIKLSKTIVEMVEVETKGET